MPRAKKMNRSTPKKGKLRDCPHNYTSRAACPRCTNEDNGGVEFAPEGPNEEDF